MAAKQLLPGYGNAYTSEAIQATDAGAAGADTIDTSRCSQFAVQVSAVASMPATSTCQVQQTMDGTNWANLGSAMAIVLGSIIRFGANSGPYGKIRLLLTESDTGDSDSDAGEVETATFTIVGFEMQGRS